MDSLDTDWFNNNSPQNHDDPVSRQDRLVNKMSLEELRRWRIDTARQASEQGKFASRHNQYLKDTIRDTLPVETTTTVCVELERGMNPASTTYSYCNGGSGVQTGTLGTYTLNTITGCIEYTAGSVKGTESPILQTV